MPPVIEWSRYRALVFDCDGVVMDSNAIKRRAIYRAALPYGEQHAQALLDYHVAHGGISRYAKFEMLLRDMLGLPVTPEAMQQMLDTFAAVATEELLRCDLAPGLADLRRSTAAMGWMMVSGADQAELRQILAQRGISAWFDLGIFGSPDTKDVILQRELQAGRLQQPALFLGDSRYDHLAAVAAGLDFVFVSAWSEFDGWQDYCAGHGIPVIETL